MRYGERVNIITLFGFQIMLVRYRKSENATYNIDDKIKPFLLSFASYSTAAKYFHRRNQG